MFNGKACVTHTCQVMLTGRRCGLDIIQVTMSLQTPKVKPLADRLTDTTNRPYINTTIMLHVTASAVLHYVQGGPNMTGTDLCVNKPHCAAAVRP